MPVTEADLPLASARRIWLRAQRLDRREPFGAGPEATRLAVEHLGYVQIDTINVIERSHHHILFTRIPRYRRADLIQAQSVDKSVFEYWTHALAYIPTRDFRYFWPLMRRHRRQPELWGQSVDPRDYRRVIRMIRESGPITIRDIDDEILVEKEHLWASRKPSKGALQLAFWNGVLTISARSGMLKTYELMERHFGWNRPPAGATERQFIGYLLDTALRAQGVVSIDSIAHVRRNIRKPLMAAIEARVRRKQLAPVTIAGIAHWAEPETLETMPAAAEPLVHILSPFDPMVIQRKRLKLFFGYEHVFEAYVPRDKRRFGYFTLPVLFGDEVVAALDLKTDRAAGKLLIQAWHWVGPGRPRTHKRAIEDELGRFERFQLGH
ncbi:MAG TPA: crosslink repair DNA glycosylase YcaQ family protein [Devosia sp.]|nr:crosslink repair DNA glycosylase YcaQ family protein [Devosia sp.]